MNKDNTYYKKCNRIIAMIISVFVLFSSVLTQAYRITAEEDPPEEETIVSIEETAEPTQEENPIEQEEDTEIDDTNDFNAEEIIESEEEIDPTIEEEVVVEEEIPIEEEPVIEEVIATPFHQEVTVDDVVVTVDAEEGVFPDGSSLFVEKVEEKDLNEINQAIEEVRKENIQVATSYTFDIKVLDAEENEIQPTDHSKVKVSFALVEANNENLEAQVYHIDEDLNVNPLDTNVEEESVVVETDGFSYYTVEFTYENKQYVLQGDETIPLKELLDAVGLVGEVTRHKASNPNLFNVYRGDTSGVSYHYGRPINNQEGDILYLVSLKAFDTEEWLKVTIDEIEYLITVTDDNPVNNPPIVKEGVDFETDIVYKGHFDQPTITVEGITIYRMEKYFHKLYTEMSTNILMPITSASPTITVDYGTIGTLDGENIVLTVIFSEFQPVNITSLNNFGDQEVFKFDYMALDEIIQNDLGATGQMTTKYYEESLNPDNPDNIIGTPYSYYYGNVDEEYMIQANEMFFNVSNDPRLGFHIYNVAKCKISYDLRYEDGTALNNPAITFSSLNSHANSTQPARSVKVADVMIDGEPVQYRIAVPSTNYNQSKVESVKPINPVKLSIVEENSLIDGPFPFRFQKGEINDYEWVETIENGVKVRTWTGQIVDDEDDDGWYYADPDAPIGNTTDHPSKQDYMYNPLTGIVDQLNMDIAITAFYADSRNMEAYVGDVMGRTWQTSNIIAKGVHYDLTVDKETNCDTTDQFNYRLKIWKDIETEEVIIDEEDLTTQAYAVFDSSTGTLSFFRDEPNTYTNGQIDGTKTYYTNFENIPVQTNGGVLTDIPWNGVRTRITKIVFEDDIIPTNTDVFFADMTNLTIVEGSRHLLMHKVEAARAMFRNCRSLTALDTSNFYMPNCRVMGSMFTNCSNLEYLDMSFVNFERFTSTSQGLITGFANMFSGCPKLSTELFIPAMPQNHGSVFLNSAMAPGAQIKFKTFALTQDQLQFLIDNAGLNSNIVFDGYLDEIPTRIPDYINQGEIHYLSEHKIFDLLDDPRFTYHLDTQEYAFTLGGNESLTIEDIPKNYNYIVYECDADGNKINVNDNIENTEWKLVSEVNTEGDMNGNQTATLRNELVHDLTISKNTVDNETGTFTFKISAQTSNGDPIDLNASYGLEETSTADEYQFTVSNGESKTLEGLSHGITYTITEDAQYGWELKNSTNTQGTLEADTEAIFTNEKKKKNITLKKIWDDNDNADNLRPDDLDAFMTFAIPRRDTYTDGVVITGRYDRSYINDYHVREGHTGYRSATILLSQDFKDANDYLLRTDYQWTLKLGDKEILISPFYESSGLDVRLKDTERFADQIYDFIVLEHPELIGTERYEDANIEIIFGATTYPTKVKVEEVDNDSGGLNYVLNLEVLDTAYDYERYDVDTWDQSHDADGYWTWSKTVPFDAVVFDYNEENLPSAYSQSSKEYDATSDTYNITNTRKKKITVKKIAHGPDDTFRFKILIHGWTNIFNARIGHLNNHDGGELFEANRTQLSEIAQFSGQRYNLNQTYWIKTLANGVEVSDWGFGLTYGAFTQYADSFWLMDAETQHNLTNTYISADSQTLPLEVDEGKLLSLDLFNYYLFDTKDYTYLAENYDLDTRDPIYPYKEFTITTTDGEGTFVIEDVPYGYEYEILEETENGWRLVSKENDTGTIVDDTIATFVNEKRTNLTIEKKITGNMGNKEDVFNFTITLKQHNSPYVVNPLPEGVSGSNGSYTFKLGHQESVTFENLPQDISYEVSEDEANRDGYTTITSISGDTVTSDGAIDEEDIEVGSGKQIVKDSSLNASTSVIYENRRGEVIPTGVKAGFSISLVMMFVSVIGLFIFHQKKRNA